MEFNSLLNNLSANAVDPSIITMSDQEDRTMESDEDWRRTPSPSQSSVFLVPESPSTPTRRGSRTRKVIRKCTESTCYSTCNGGCSKGSSSNNNSRRSRSGTPMPSSTATNSSSIDPYKYPSESEGEQENFQKFFTQCQKLKN